MLDIQPWHVASWPTVTWSPTQCRTMIRRLTPRAGNSFVEPGANGVTLGQVLWACNTGDGPVGLAWDWVEVRPRVVAIADPMRVMSNLDFVDDAGRPLREGLRVIELNNLVASLSWQAHLFPQEHPVSVPLPMAA